MAEIHLNDPVAWAVKAFRDGRNDTYDMYQEYINGYQPLAFATPKFRNVFGRMFSAFAYNRCHMAVTAHTDRLQNAGFGADDPDMAQAAQDVWDANRMDVREGHLFGDALGLGDSYLIVEHDPVSDDVHYWTQAPQSMRVHWSEKRPDEIDLAVKVWFDDDKYCHMTVYSRGRVDRYISRQRAPSGVPRTASAFQAKEVEGEVQSFALPVADQVPVFHFPNNGRTNSYGVSELGPVVPLQNAVNKTLMDMMVAMEVAAYPQRVLIGVDAPTTEEEKRLWDAFEAGITKLWAVGEGQGQAGIAEFSAANILQYIAVAEFLDKAVSRVTKVPVHWLGMSGDFASGRALRIAESAFVSKIEDRQKAFGYTISEVQRYALRLQGKNVEPGQIRVNWQSAEAMSDEDALDMMMQKKAIGMPFEAILRESGYEPDQITAILDEKRKAVDEAAAMFGRGLASPVREEAA